MSMVPITYALSNVYALLKCIIKICHAYSTMTSLSVESHIFSKKKVHSRPPTLHPKLWVYKLLWSYWLPYPRRKFSTNRRAELGFMLVKESGQSALLCLLSQQQLCYMIDTIFECYETSGLWPHFACCVSDHARVHVCTQGYICHIIWTRGEERSWERYKGLAWVNCVHVLWSSGDPSRLYSCLSPSDPNPPRDTDKG